MRKRLLRKRLTYYSGRMGLVSVGEDSKVVGWKPFIEDLVKASVLDGTPRPTERLDSS